MVTLKGKNIFLRALEPSDLEFLYELENDETFWEVSNTSTPYSKYVLKQYLDNSHRDIFEVKQLRLVLSLYKTNTPVGFIDLFDFDPKNKRAGVGIIVFPEKNKRNGYASEALQILKEYAFIQLGLHQLFANISEENTNSITLFEKAGYKKSGSKQDWIHTSEGYKNEFLYQLIKNVH